MLSTRGVMSNDEGQLQRIADLRKLTQHDGRGMLFCEIWKKNETNMDQKNSWMIQDNIFNNRQLKSLNQVDTTVQRRFFSFEFTVDSGQKNDQVWIKWFLKYHYFGYVTLIYAYMYLNYSTGFSSTCCRSDPAKSTRFKLATLGTDPQPATTVVGVIEHIESWETSTSWYFFQGSIYSIFRSKDIYLISMQHAYWQYFQCTKQQNSGQHSKYQSP